MKVIIISAKKERLHTFFFYDPGKITKKLNVIFYLIQTFILRFYSITRILFRFLHSFVLSWYLMYWLIKSECSHGIH
jgi:hypothetical protein